MKTQITTNFLDVLHEKINDSISGNSIDSKSIYYACINNKYWCSVYKSSSYYGLVIRHVSRGLLFHDYFADDDVAYEAFIFSLKVCRSAKD